MCVSVGEHRVLTPDPAAQPPLLRNSCPFPHDIHSEVNIAALKANKVSNLDRKGLQVLLQLNDPFLLPEVCKIYKGESKGGSCIKGASCKSLHICGFFIRGRCWNASCNRSHNFLDAKNLQVMLDRKLSLYMIRNIQLLRTYQCRHVEKECKDKKTEAESPKKDLLKVSTPTDDANPNEICLHNIWKYCKNQSKCVQVHFYLPYRWQILTAAEEWRDLDTMEEIEEAFCDPNQSRSGIHKLDFQNMMMSSQRVRRLSTTSSVTKSPDFILTTEWIWYWKNEFGHWIDYGKHGGKETATVNSAALESAYLANQNAAMKFQAGSHTYEINFQDMIQMNLDTGMKRDVLRRPLFVSQKDVQRLKASRKAQAFPAYWDKMARSNEDFQLVDVPDHSPEFQKIQREFEKTMFGFSLQKIRRIQNTPLWQAYQLKLKNMKTVNKSKDVLEKKLFHRSDTRHVDSICRENFDWRIYGVQGVLYGKGSYFSRDASYSHQHCKSSSSSNTMFLARVLVGNYVQGNSTYLRPPPKPTNPLQTYDSCVDNKLDPSVFVIFEKHQIYPDYILEYIEDKMQRNRTGL